MTRHFARGVPDELGNTIHALHERLLAFPDIEQTHNQSLFEERPAFWYYGLLSELALIVGITDIVRVQADLHVAEGATRKYVFSVFTPGLLIIANGGIPETMQDRHGGRRVRAISRTRLRRVEVKSGANPFGSDDGPQWPGNVNVRAEYEGLGEPLDLTFPWRASTLEPTASDFIPNLLSDLS